jgi:hypothetical protein
MFKVPLEEKLFQIRRSYGGIRIRKEESSLLEGLYRQKPRLY